MRASALAGGGALAVDLLALARQVVVLDVELGQRLADALVLRGRVLDRVAQRRHRVERREDLGARRLDVAFEPFDLLLRARPARPRRRPGRRPRRRAPLGVGQRLAPRVERNARRLAPRLEVADLVGDLGGAADQHLGLVAVELLLLLAAVDVELAGVCVLADPRGARVGFRLLDAAAG